MPSTPTPIPAPPSSALHMTQINALNKQIQELLAKNVELRRDLDAERVRGEKVVLEIAQRSKEEVAEVKAVAETARLVSKISHLDTLWMAGEERWEVLCAVDDIRKERIERTKLEFRILQFQVRERELEYRIDYLQDQLDNILEGLNAAEKLHQDQMNDLSEQYNSSFSTLETRLVSLSARLKSTRIKRDSLATQLTILKTSNTSLQVSLNDSKKESDSFQRNIERLKLELEGKDRDAKEMREQLKGWQRLEGKGNEEIGAERAKRVGLEVELKVEKDRVKEGKKQIKGLLSEFEATQAELQEAQIEIESLKGDIEKAMKGSMKAKKTLAQAQAGAEEQQKATAKRKRLAEDGLDEPVTKKAKRRQPPLRSNSGDVCSTSSGHGHKPSPPPVPKPKKFHEKKPVALPIHDVSSKPVKKDKNANTQPRISNLPPDDDEREEPDAQMTRPTLTEMKSPLSKTTRAKVKPSIGTIPSQEEKKLKTPAEHPDTVAPTKAKKKVNLGGGRGLLASFGGLGGIGASSINWGGEMGRPNAYGIPPTLSSPIRANRDEAAKAPQGSMFTFGANR